MLKIVAGTLILGVTASEGTACTRAYYIDHMLTSSAILFMRIWALWNRSMKLAVVLGATLLGAIIGIIVIGVHWENTFVGTVKSHI